METTFFLVLMPCYDFFFLLLYRTQYCAQLRIVLTESTVFMHSYQTRQQKRKPFSETGDVDGEKIERKKEKERWILVFTDRCLLLTKSHREVKKKEKNGAKSGGRGSNIQNTSLSTTL